MPDENTNNELESNTQETQNTPVHYHLTSRMFLDEEHACNGDKPIIGNFINPAINPTTEIARIIISSNHLAEGKYEEKDGYYLKDNNNLKYDYYSDNAERKIYTIKDNGKIKKFIYGIKMPTGELTFVSFDNKGNIDKTKSGDTFSIFSKKNQYYHGGSYRTYNEQQIQEKFSFTLFYARNTIVEESQVEVDTLLTGLGQIQNKIGVLNTVDDKRRGKIYCYNHYDNTGKHYLFRFPFHELIALKKDDSIKETIKEILEALKIEDSDKTFFSKEQSKIVPTMIILKYARRMYEQIMKLKQDKDLWGKIEAASKDADSNKKWHFCDNESILFLKKSIKDLQDVQKNLSYPGLWAIKDYFESKEIDIFKKQFKDKGQSFTYENFLKLCSGVDVCEFELNELTFFDENTKTYKIFNNFLNKFTINTLIKYPIYNSLTIERVIKHLYNKKIMKLADINKNPYLLFEKYIQNDDAPLLLDDIDWGQKIIKKDALPKDAFQKDNPFRLRAIVCEYIKKQEKQTGHVWVSYEDAQEYLVNRLIELDGGIEKFITIEDFTKYNINSLKFAINSEKDFTLNFDAKLIREKNFRAIFKFEEKLKFLTLKEFAIRETYIKGEIEELIEKSLSKKEEVLQKQLEFERENPNNKYRESEFSLIKMKTLDFVFISGVAGSGKSHTLCHYLDYLCSQETVPDFQVLTPSGKAANVLKNKIKDDKETFPKIYSHLFLNTETSDNKDKKISTADRYIVDNEIYWNKNLFARFYNTAKNDKEIDVLIIDEISMITLDTLYYILKTKKPNKLIILGDIKQLPPIGYGALSKNIYNHLFLESSFHNICLAKMETSHRADDSSLFIKHSLTLRDKEKQLEETNLKKESNNFKLCSYSSDAEKKIEDKLKAIYKLENENIENFKTNIIALNEKIQILTPNRIGDSGTNAINKIFTDTLGTDKLGYKFIYNINDKKTGLSNGTMGYITGSDEKIVFDDQKIKFNENNLNGEYDYGFAITVHKSQGSGFPIVILVLPEKNNSLITRELIYTALTRPEQKMYILYHEKNIQALTMLPSIAHRNMNIFEQDKYLWEKSSIDYPINYNGIEYRRKQDLYCALMLEYSNLTTTYHKNGAFVWEEGEEGEEDRLLMPKLYEKEVQDTKSFKYLKSIDLSKIYTNFEFKIGANDPAKRNNENKEDVISDKDDAIEITTHNGLKTRSWSEAILMLIFDNLKIPYFYEVELRREGEVNTYKLTYPKPTDKAYRIPDFTIVAPEPIVEFSEEKKETPIVIDNVKCIIEHLGKLNDAEYLIQWKEKIKEYYNKYKFDIIAPLSSLSKENGIFYVSAKWENVNDNPTVMTVITDKNICFTTDEEDFNEIPTLIENLKLLKELYSLPQ
ncbi:MAG: AAA family ATPase [Arcobacteraceae bacterium]